MARQKLLFSVDDYLKQLKRILDGGTDVAIDAVGESLNGLENASVAANMVVYWADGTIDGLALSKADATATAEAIGVTNIAGTTAIDTVFSGIAKVSTDASGAVAAGGSVYVSQTTAGKVTGTKPATGIVKKLGTAKDAISNGSTGFIFLAPEPAFDASEDSQVMFTAGVDLLANNVVCMNASDKMIKAIATAAATVRAIGAVTAAILTDAQGVVDMGPITKCLKEADTEIIVSNDPLYLSASVAGTVTKTSPSTPPQLRKVLGYAKAASGSGTATVDIIWRPRSAIELG